MAQDLQTKTISRRKAEDLIKNSRGTSFNCLFIKRDGSLRQMRALYGVKVELTGRGMAYKADERGNVVVWDIDNRGYRSIKINTLLELKINERQYTITN